MILTSEDFGRAYLTQADGWARRFLVDLFADTVSLFIGYSHHDTIMNYLTPSLDKHSSNHRYALIGIESDIPSRWERMGIQPIRFSQKDNDDYSQLDMAIEELAKHVHRGFLDWRRIITDIAAGMPPVDEESADIIDHALSDPTMTRFFVDTAAFPEWINWLDRRNYLSALFVDETLNEQQTLLANWLISRFAIKSPDTLFSAIQRHGAKLNSVLWEIIIDQLYKTEKDTFAPTSLARWVIFSVNHIPAQPDSFTLLKLAKACIYAGTLDYLLLVYDAMIAHINRPLTLGDRSTLPHKENYAMHQIRENYLKPNLPEIAESLLTRTSNRIAERHSMLKAWGQDDASWDIDSIRRPTIEPNEQNGNNQTCDHLIDIARDCLEWLVANQCTVARQWSDRHINSPVTILRRLAIHTLSVRTDLTATSKISFILEHCNIHENHIRHEIFRATKQAYPQCETEQRKKLIETILAYQPPNQDQPDTKRMQARQHLDWVHWLHQADPKDEVAAEALALIMTQFPDLYPRNHVDFIYYTKTSTRPF